MSSITNLTQDHVSVLKTIDDNPWRKSYDNSDNPSCGRTAVQAELNQDEQDEIFAIWGDTATFTYS